MTFSEDVFKDLHGIEADFKNLTPNLMVKIQTLKLEVRYILPYLESALVTNEQRYEETILPFRIEERPKDLEELVDYLMEQTLLIKPDATGFYLHHYEGEYDSLKTADYVLDNLKYVQSPEANQTVAVKEQVKAVEEKLRFVRTFCMKWKRSEPRRFEEKLCEIYESMDSVSRLAAHLFQLFKVETFDENENESEAPAIELALSDLLLKINVGQLLAKEVYFEVLEISKLSLPDTCPLNFETVCGFIDSLQDNLKEISTCLCHLTDSREHEIQNILLEIEFLRSILMDPWKELVEHGKLDAISIHIDVLGHEAESVVCSSLKELEEQDNHAMMVKLLNLIEKIKLTKHKIRETNRKDMMLVYSFIDDFLRCATFLVSDNVKVELKFLRTFLKCTARWCVDHPQLRAIRIHTENVVHRAWWDFRCLCFNLVTFRIPVTEEDVDRLDTDLQEKLKINKPEIGEVCATIRSLKSSQQNSPMSENLGLEFADTLSDSLRDLQYWNPESFSLMKDLLDDYITCLGIVREISAERCSEDKSQNDLLTHLEDLTERAACLSYLHLVENGKANQAMSLCELLQQIEEPEVRNTFLKFIEAPVFKLSAFEQQTDELMLYVVDTLTENLTKLTHTAVSMVASVEAHAQTLLRELFLLRCILMDSLKQYSEQVELDDLFKDIGAGVSEAGIVFCYLYVTVIKESLHSNVVETVELFKATVRRAYFKFAKLSPSKLLKHEWQAFDILLGNLMEIKKGYADAAASTVHQIGVLHDALVICSSFIRDNAFKHNEREELKHLRAQIMSVRCKVEHVIVTFGEIPLFFSEMRLCDVTEEATVIKEEIAKIYGTRKLDTEVGDSGEMSQKMKDKYKVAEHFKKETKPSKTQDEVMLGFEDEEDKLIKQLTRGSSQLEIISIVGMPGLGKTTLAMNVYKGVADYFHTHAWCYVSQDYRKKELLQHIISEVNGPSSEINMLNEWDLAQKLYQCLLKKRNYLIVLDDIWDTKAWNDLKACFPPSNNGSRILLTSRFKSIGLQAGDDSTCLELGLLPIKKSWHLLEKKVFGEGICPSHLRTVGEEIVERSGGLPLTIVVIAGVLKNIEETEDKWKEIAESLDSPLVKNQKDVLHKLEPSYRHLPIHLKQCFLYCGAFQRGEEIPRSKLVRLWISERFICETDQQQNLEDEAECYLRELVNRSLLIVAKTGSDNRIRSCRIHDLLRDFCILKAEEENFRHILNRWTAFPIWQRRLYFCCTWEEFEHSEHSLSPTPLTHSLMFFGTSSTEACDISFIVRDFRLLTVLDVGNIPLYADIPESIARLNLLRYLSIGGLIKNIPSSIGELWNLRTLIVRGIRGEVEIPDTIFNLTNLRHLLVNSRAKVSGNTSGASLSSLQSFSTPALCGSTSDQILTWLPNLRKLRCIFLDDSTNFHVFPLLDFLSHLESLKVFYHGVVKYPWKFSIYPWKLSLPLTLKKLTLSKFRFPWSVMEMIAALPHLEILKLLVKAFEGQRWDTSTIFRKLKYLRLEDLDFEEWEASYDDFPILERLVVRRCKHLKSIPESFSDIHSLKCVEVHWCSRSVAKSAMKIELEQRQSGNKQFKTITYPTEFDLTDELSD